MKFLLIRHISAGEYGLGLVSELREPIRGMDAEKIQQPFRGQFRIEIKKWEMLTIASVMFGEIVSTK